MNNKLIEGQFNFVFLGGGPEGIPEEFQTSFSRVPDVKKMKVLDVLV
jgi:hypothetical protein